MPGGEYMAELATVLNLINYIFVLIFGIVVSFYFADIPWEDNKKLHIYTLMGFILLQAVYYMLLGEHTLYKSYPFLIHSFNSCYKVYLPQEHIHILNSCSVSLSYVHTKKMVRYGCCIHFQRHTYDIGYHNDYCDNSAYLSCHKISVTLYDKA